ncbi:MAG TPA: [protein-PII] uridylyltransferase [Opitutaceae bacterium]|nr:[protein-PII] uridylyltransferase [Opitutaceae bacterium]
MPGHIHQHARKRLNFAGELSVAARLAACKEFLKDETAALHARHVAGESGLKVVHDRAQTVDELLKHLFDYALESYARAHGPVPTPVALLALGGYGRGELSPWSDIDVMFLFPTKTKPAVAKPLQQHLTDEILYILWDCGLKVGHSTRTIDDAFAEARKDIQTKTALLESRLIAGSEKLYDTFAQAYRSYYISEDPKSYIAARLDDQTNRRTKFANTVFNQEPDIKNGVGGLRDYQNAVWMARVKLDITTIDELAPQNYLRADDLAAFRRAYDFLLRVRNELHFTSARATDVMSLDLQPRIAESLGYTEPEMLPRVEHFMQDYYRAAQTIFRVSKLVEDRLALSIGRNESGGTRSFRETLLASRFQRTKRIDGFILRGRQLAAEKPEVFRDDPVRLIRVFRHSQQLEATLDFPLTELIRISLELLTREVAWSPDASVCFRAILSEAGAVHPILTKMHELGVLGKFIPEFDALTCLVQHEYYHRYTADVHTLNAIRELDRIYTEAEPITLKYRAAIHETTDPALLYLTLLLHDIGKAEGIQGHAESGVRLAAPLLERFGVSAEGRELVAFVIKNHLAMARFWQKRDVDDPKTATAFAELVGTTERLRHLYVHTFCDARGTAADLWNSYKDTLHTTLYRSTFERLKHGEAAVDASLQEKKKMTQQDLIAKSIPGISADEINAHFGLLPDRYFIHTDADEIALHIQMVNRLLKSITAADSVSSLKPVIEWKDDLNRSLTIVNVVTWDRAGLFYKLAGAFSVAGLNILGAKVISRTDHIAIDTFYVVEPGRGPVQSATAQEKFAKTIEDALVNNRDLLPDIMAQAKKIAATRYLSASSGETLQSSFPPTVDVYHELSMQRTIVEIQARDQIGLLYRLAKTISDQGFDITFARIGTERGVAIDTFYIEGANHEPIENPERLTTLRDALNDVIAPAPAAVAAAGK